jgi:hypothetical protein
MARTMALGPRRALPRGSEDRAFPEFVAAVAAVDLLSLAVRVALVSVDVATARHLAAYGDARVLVLWVSAVAGGGVVLLGIASDALLLLRRRLAWMVGWFYLGVTAASIAATFWWSFVESQHPLQGSPLPGEGNFWIYAAWGGGRIALAGLYAAALVRFRAWCRQTPSV